MPIDLERQLIQRAAELPPLSAVAGEYDGALTVLVEMNCQQGARTVRHDRLKYDRYYELVEEELLHLGQWHGDHGVVTTRDGSADVALRVERTQPLQALGAGERVGAFEVYLLSKEDHLLAALGGATPALPRCTCIFSKLDARRWPSPRLLAARCRALIDNAFAHVALADGGAAITSVTVAFAYRMVFRRWAEHAAADRRIECELVEAAILRRCARGLRQLSMRTRRERVFVGLRRLWQRALVRHLSVWRRAAEARAHVQRTMDCIVLDHLHERFTAFANEAAFLARLRHAHSLVRVRCMTRGMIAWATYLSHERRPAEIRQAVTDHVVRCRLRWWHVRVALTMNACALLGIAATRARERRGRALLVRMRTAARHAYLARRQRHDGVWRVWAASASVSRIQRRRWYDARMWWWQRECTRALRLLAIPARRARLVYMHCLVCAMRRWSAATHAMIEHHDAMLKAGQLYYAQSCVHAISRFESMRVRSRALLVCAIRRRGLRQLRRQARAIMTWRGHLFGAVRVWRHQSRGRAIARWQQHMRTYYLLARLRERIERYQCMRLLRAWLKHLGYINGLRRGFIYWFERSFERWCAAVEAQRARDEKAAWLAAETSRRWALRHTLKLWTTVRQHRLQVFDRARAGMTFHREVLGRRSIKRTWATWTAACADGLQERIYRKTRAVLQQAAREGGVERVEALLQAGTPVNAADEDDGATPLMLVSKSGHLETLHVLLRRGADVHRTMTDGWCALALASQGGHARVVSGLLAAGAAVDVRLDNGWTPLMLAAVRGHDETVRTLLDARASIDARSRAGETALMGACRHGCLEVARTLITCGANVALCTADGETALVLAEEHEHQVMSVLREGRGVVEAREHARSADADVLAAVRAVIGMSTAEEAGHRALSAAVDDGRVDVAEALIRSGVPVDGVDSDGQSTALMLACKRGSSGMVAMLVRMGADMNARMNHGWGPLTLASHAGHTPLVTMLITAGASVNRTLDDGRTPLMLASAHGDEATVRALLDAGADLNERSGDGETALTASCRHGRMDIAQLLISTGADLSAVTRDGRSALELAEGHGLGVLRMLRGEESRAEEERWHPPSDEGGALAAVRAVVATGGADGAAKALRAAAESGAVGVVESLLQVGVPVNAADEDDLSSPLMLACRGGRRPVVQVLLRWGADADATMRDGWSALSLMCAAAGEGGSEMRDERVEIIRMLLKAGASVDMATAKDGWTSLMLASAHGDVGIARALIDAGASVHARAHSGETALTSACRNGRVEMAWALLGEDADIRVTTNDRKTPLQLARSCGPKMEGVVREIEKQLGQTERLRASLGGRGSLVGGAVSWGAASPGTPAISAARASGLAGAMNLSTSRAAWNQLLSEVAPSVPPAQADAPVSAPEASLADAPSGRSDRYRSESASRSAARLLSRRKTRGR